MHITARLEEETVKALIGELLPLTVVIEGGGERWIRIEPARHIDFVAGQGLRVETHGKLRWPTVGLPLTFTFKTAQLMLRPVVTNEDDGARLVFRPVLETLDLKMVPDFIDSGILNMVNARLAAQGDALAWHLGKTLTGDVPLPPTLVQVDRLQFRPHRSEVVVLDDAIELTVGFEMGFLRRTALDPPPGDEDDEAQSAGA